MTTNQEKKDVALVLSSGGARGLAHIGAIDELEGQGYHITSVAGCSMGALVGGMYAAGKLAEFKQWMMGIDKKKILSLLDLSLSINHLVKGVKIIDALKEVVPDVKIEDLDIPFCAVATDWESGREVVFRKGSLYEAIRASISLPLFFDPVKRDGMVMVDGGIMNPLPLNRVARTGDDLLVAVNVSAQYDADHLRLREAVEQQKPKAVSKAVAVLRKLLPGNLDLNYVTLLTRMYSLMIQQNAVLSAKLYHPDVLVDIAMNRFGSFEYDQVAKISKLGQMKMKKALMKVEG
jgi:NTE family protein